MPESLLIAVGVVLVLCGLDCAYNRWLQPWMTRRWIDQILAKIPAGDYVPPPKQSDVALAINAAGITVCCRRPIFEPLHSIACICLAITTKAGTTTEVSEDMEGWEALTDALPKHLSGSKSWTEAFPLVAFPAFATNETVIFEKASSQPSKCGTG